MLADDLIRAFQAATSPQKLFNEKGLYLLLTPAGGRLWQFEYHSPPRCCGNNEKLISLGSYPEVSLAQAREPRDAARRDIATRIDPSLRRTCERIRLGNAFESVAREFIGVLRAANISPENPSWAAADLIEKTRMPSPRSRRRKPISAETVDTMERRLELHVYPYIGGRDVRLLTARELLEVLRRIESRGTCDLAHRVRSICSRVLRYARATGRQCKDVAADLMGSLSPVESQPLAAIVEPSKIGALLRSIEATGGDPVTRLALRLMPYIFPRPIEFRTIEWAHVQLHGATPEWRIPWRRMKMRAPHIVSISRVRGAQVLYALVTTLWVCYFILWLIELRFDISIF